jgi:hypothetical protein
MPYLEYCMNGKTIAELSFDRSLHKDVMEFIKQMRTKIRKMRISERGR